ncbi:uncharacterized protein C14orf93 homolog [Amphiprion ocellaris]|uniref:uncharacterized protein C14orf93 homolog n=1 Tax=Amphiprion ocellaris TaxID=80972 RepID=UPI00241175B1|nr:uncharacterized protein C14orf93 homolog [Amphiprion ocellaris]
MAAQAEAMKSSAPSHHRRKRLLDARKTVLAPDEEDFWKSITADMMSDEEDFWKSITADMMSDEEDGSVDGVRGWIVRPPSFHSQELANLCAALQAGG